MLRAIVPVGILMFVGMSIEPAQAAICPTGQFYRVSMKVCQTRSTAMKQIKGEKPVAKQKMAKTEPVSRIEKSAEKSAKPSPDLRSARVLLPSSRPARIGDDEGETTRGYTPDPVDASVRAKALSRNRQETLPDNASSFSPYGALSPFGTAR